MTQWRTARLEEIAEVFGGGTPSRTEDSYFGGDIAWATPTDVTSLNGFYISATKETVTEAGLKNSSTKLLPAGVVLLTSRATIGFTAVSTIPICTNQGFVNFVCGADLQPEFLAYWLRTQREKMLRHAGGTTFKEIARGTLRKFEIAFPSLAEQRRIVDLLSRAEGIMRLCREAQRKAAELIPAIFLDLFGDPATNPKRWPVVTFSDIADTQLGKMLDKKKQTGLCTFPYLGNSNVRWGDFDLGDLLQMDFKESERIKFELRAGDLLVCEGGEIGRAAIWRGQKEDCYFQKALHRVKPKPTRAVSEFILWWLWTMAQHGLLASAGAKATIAHLPAEKLRALKVALPPIELQHQFAAKAEAVRGIATRQTAALATAQATFDALLHRAFAN